MPAWPATLPCGYQIQNLDLTPHSNSIAIEPEVGSPLSRERFTGAMEDINGSLMLRSRQLAIALLAFWRDDLQHGSLPFTGLNHPITGAAVSMIFMAQPKFSRNGTLYQASVSLRTMPP